MPWNSQASLHRGLASPNRPVGARHRRRVVLVARLLLVLFSLLLPLVVLEAALRLLGPILPGEYQTGTFFSPDPVIGRRARPGTSGWVRTSEFVTWVRVNSQGLRGPEVPFEKPPGAYRVMVLGDSFTFALQVPEQQTFVQQLQLRLVEGGARGVETVNAGTDGWSTIDEYTWLTTEGYRYQPDLVVLMFFAGNDPSDNANQMKAAERYWRSLGLAADRGGPLDALREALRRNSALYNAFEHGVLVKIKVQTEGTPPWINENQAADRPAPMKQSQGWEASEAWILRLRDYCQANGLGLVVVGIPADYHVRATKPSKLPLAESVERLGLPYVELLETFHALPQRERRRLYLEENRHWTAEGHDLAAQAVARVLLARGLVPTGGS